MRSRLKSFFVFLITTPKIAICIFIILQVALFLIYNYFNLFLIGLMNANANFLVKYLKFDDPRLLIVYSFIFISIWVLVNGIMTYKLSSFFDKYSDIDIIFPNINWIYGVIAGWLTVNSSMLKYMKKRVEVKETKKSIDFVLDKLDLYTIFSLVVFGFTILTTTLYKARKDKKDKCIQEITKKIIKKNGNKRKTKKVTITVDNSQLKIIKKLKKQKFIKEYQKVNNKNDQVTLIAHEKLFELKNK